MKKLGCVIVMLVCLAVFSSCRNTDRQVQLLVDMWTGAGEFKGYATVYEHDMDEEEYVQESFGNAVYEDEDGYYIEWDGDSWDLEELDEPIDPFGYGVTLLRYKFYNYYIEDIPHSY